MPIPVHIHAIREADWQLARALRLEMLADTPLAYLETRETAEARAESEWRQRAGRNELLGNAAFAAVDVSSGRWRGSMNCFVREDAAHLVSVYVAPDSRGRAHGVTDALLDAVIEWSRAQGVDSLVLEVHERNARAAAYYERRGFRATGRYTPYALNTAERDLEMVLDLTAEGSR
ncbi:GNAT family N-acetyltransferase [Planctomonas psychrotolerans]|uniref:GNAT family N-acetyltransferase n=1 Tax=Planctomonas psychrotolerans TaxID=2528712 RepID=UPI00123C431D|nr:GNAT family N-acetyltransferase [Planctomonas psychrotolerans]